MKIFNIVTFAVCVILACGLANASECTFNDDTVNNECKTISAILAGK
jgi:hypothetical protein